MEADRWVFGPTHQWYRERRALMSGDHRRWSPRPWGWHQHALCDEAHQLVPSRWSEELRSELPATNGGVAALLSSDRPSPATTARVEERERFTLMRRSQHMQMSGRRGGDESRPWDPKTPMSPCNSGEVIPASTVLILMVERAHVTQEVKAELKVASASCESKSGRQRWVVELTVAEWHGCGERGQAQVNAEREARRVCAPSRSLANRCWRGVLASTHGGHTAGTACQHQAPLTQDAGSEVGWEVKRSTHFTQWPLFYIFFEFIF